MAMKLFVGGLSWDTNDDTLKQFFVKVGPVVSASVITDRYTGKSRGFGFVEMENDADAKKAIEELNGKELDGRAINVNEAKPREPRSDSFNRGGGNGGRDDRRGGGGGGRDSRDRRSSY